MCDLLEHECCFDHIEFFLEKSLKNPLKRGWRLFTLQNFQGQVVRR